MKKILIWLLMLLSLFSFTHMVYADTGPKPKLEVIASNMPDELCYMDLLIDYPVDNVYSNIDKIDGYDMEMINVLKKYNKNGWRSAMVTGTNVPMFGDIKCNIMNGKCNVEYGYVGLPDRFKIIVVTKSHQIVVSNQIERKAFSSKVYFDFQTGKAYEDLEIPLYIKQFIETFVLTLVIEGIILLLFGFSIKKNYKLFLTINLITQLLLLCVVGIFMINKGTIYAFISYLLFEVVILIIETILFSRYLCEHNICRRRLYAVVANLISFLVGVIMLLC